MGILDLSPRTTDEALASARPGEFPAGFDEAFEASWRAGQMFNQSVARSNARGEALGDYIDQVNRLGGNVSGELSNKISISGEYTDDDRLEAANAALRKAKEKDPSITLDEMTDDGLEQSAIRKSREAQRGEAEIAQRGTTMAGTLGGLAGGFASAATDPINIVGMAVAPEAGIGLLSSALRWSAIAGVNQAAIEEAGAEYREAVQPGYAESGAPLRSVAEAALTGGALPIAGAGAGAAIRMLGRAWDRVASQAWPRSIRDAGNVISSQANIAHTNVFLGAEGEAAHWEALDFTINSLLENKPVNVEGFITPELAAQSRQLVTRLEGERAMALPVFDERQIRLTSEEAALRQQDAELERQIGGMPEGDIASADRLNRLQAVDAQIAATTDQAAKRALNARRDQILVDTSPEALQEAAQPIEAKRQAVAQRMQIAGRLADIETERARIAAENLGRAQPPMIGQTEPSRLVPFEAVRAYAGQAATAADLERAALEVQRAPELPFKATELETGRQGAYDALGNSVRQIAEAGGFTLEPNEIKSIAEKIAKLSPEDAADAAKQIQLAPHQMAEGVQRFVDEDAIPRPSAAATDTVIKEADKPEVQTALRADLDRLRATADVNVPVGIDENGEPVFQSLDRALKEIDDDRNAADQIEACANPVQEAAE